jgi:hypothetical protein
MAFDLIGGASFLFSTQTLEAQKYKFIEKRAKTPAFKRGDVGGCGFSRLGTMLRL